ncbi:MAG TPA: hypothetical protein PLD83_01745, partial [Oscillospiraceae bacterium]|nr:hypothetical protein [Oscillospiraceae bacterium]HPS75140.1 hypothetical protein [Oscillospiraceae bacterium]
IILQSSTICTHSERETAGLQREFVHQLFLVNRYTVDWSTASADELLSAMETSVYDAVPLIQVVRRCIGSQTG